MRPGGGVQSQFQVSDAYDKSLEQWQKSAYAEKNSQVKKSAGRMTEKVHSSRLNRQVTKTGRQDMAAESCIISDQSPESRFYNSDLFHWFLTSPSLMPTTTG